MMELKAPVIIIGTGRCGSSSLHEVLSRHPNLAWLSQLFARFPDVPEVNRMAMWMVDSSVAPSLVRKHIRPSEAYPFWDKRYPGFSAPFRDLLRHDVTEAVAETIRESLAKTLTRRRTRLLIKITGWPRTGFLKAVFPDAKFVHIHRDGRAVAASLMSRPWWDGWGGPAQWKWGELAAEQEKRWEASGKSFLALAGLQWELLMAAFARAKQELSPRDLLEIRYDDLCLDKGATLRRIAEFAEIDWYPAFDRVVVQFPFVNADAKWKQHFTPHQRELLTATLTQSLRRYGYPTEDQYSNRGIAAAEAGSM